MTRIKPSFAEIALDIYESVEHATDKERRLKSSTFWHEFRVKRKTQPVIERVERYLNDQHLYVSVKSGREFGKEKADDWIVLNIWPPKGPGPKPPLVVPTTEWFNKMKMREFGSEREVEYYFILPMLEQLGYDESEIAIGYPVTMYDGGHRAEKEADLVTFNGPNKDTNDVLLVVEAKKSDKGINVDQIGQVKSYAKELLPACYVITNGQKIVVFQFNGMRYQDARVMDFERSMLDEMWEDLYKYVSKEATVQRKKDIISWGEKVANGSHRAEPNVN